MDKTSIGSDFDEILAEATAIKRVKACQVAQLMEEQNLTKTEMVDFGFESLGLETKDFLEADTNIQLGYAPN